MTPRPRWYAHLDMDAFYASVEVLDRPELEGLPVAVGGPSTQRGVIAAASYAARRFGVRSAMPTAQALRLCPELVLLSGRMERYQEKSREIMSILRETAPAVEPLSLDEAFLDLSGCERLHGDWVQMALRLRRRVLDETGLWCSIGMGETRRIAKIASDLRKPRGLAIIERHGGAPFLQSLPVERLWGVGPKLRDRLRGLGLYSAADIAARSRSQLQSSLGKTGLSLHDIVHARETGTVRSDRAHKSISHETTFARDKVGAVQLEPVLLHLCEKVALRIRRQSLQGRVVQLKIRDRGFHTFTRRITLPNPTDAERSIYEASRRLLANLKWDNVPVRLIGVGVTQLSAAGGSQGDLFATRAEKSEPKLEQAIDSVADRFGEDAIGRARSLLRNGNSSARPETPWQSQVYGPLDKLVDPSPKGSSPSRPAPLPSAHNKTPQEEE